MTPADVYEPPQSLRTDGLTNIYGDQGTGFTSAQRNGPERRLRSGDNAQGGAGRKRSIAPGWYNPVVINPVEGLVEITRDNIATCDSAHKAWRLAPNRDRDDGRVTDRGSHY